MKALLPVFLLLYLSYRLSPFLPLLSLPFFFLSFFSFHCFYFCFSCCSLFVCFAGSDEQDINDRAEALGREG